MKYLILIIALLTLTGCADSISFEAAKNYQEVGFFYGIWHGLILLPAMIISWFSESTAIYAIYNNGGWYDFGFWIGAILFSGGTTKAIKNV